VATEPTLKDNGRDRPSHPDPGPRGHIGWIVAGLLATGLVAAVLLAAAPFIPAEERAVTGAVLCSRSPSARLGLGRLYARFDFGSLPLGPGTRT
jgi:hypothetical protein